MYKNTFSVVALLLISQAAISSGIPPFPVACKGEVVFQGEYLDLNCSGGICSGQLSTTYFQVEGQCDSDVNFLSEGQMAFAYVSGICKNGSVSISTLAQNIPLYGECTLADNYYGSFYSSVYSPASFGSGYCQENGTSRIYLNGAVRSFSGKCRQN